MIGGGADRGHGRHSFLPESGPARAEARAGVKGMKQGL